MRITLDREIRKDEILYVGGVLKEIKLPATQLLLLDSNILFPVIFSLEERRVNKLLYYFENVIPRYRHRNKKRGRTIDKLWIERRIKVVNSIEDKKLQERGKYPVITNSVYGGLKNFERICGINNLSKWKRKLRDVIVDVIVDIKFFREAYPSLSEKFDENADFSLAITSYELGCHFASDDYKSFDKSVMNLLKGMYFDIWGPLRLERHDSESLCMKLRS